MRNAGKWCCGWMIPALIFAGWIALAGGCQANPQARQQLDSGEKSLQVKQYDQAIRAADGVIAAGSSVDLAEAYYLRGSAIEDRNPKPDASAAAADLTAARRDYFAALGYNPTRPLEARIHERLGNVAYFQDDYPVALQQLTIAFGELSDPQWKSWVLYRMGICQQRLGRFSDADRTFAAVQDQYPDTEVARRANERHGMHGFYVQIGVFSQQSDIDKASAAISAAGSIPTRAQQKGLTVIRTTGVPSYGQAVALRLRLLEAYPDARLMP